MSRFVLVLKAIAYYALPPARLRPGNQPAAVTYHESFAASEAPHTDSQQEGQRQ